MTGREHLVAELAAIADAIDFPPRRWRLWPWPRREAVRIDTIGAVVAAMRDETRPVDQDVWDALWRRSRATSTRARVTMQNDIRLASNEKGLPILL